ncbi:MAG: DUF1223 domain-containing protein [Hyphomicrobiaceae bacterium]
MLKPRTTLAAGIALFGSVICFGLPTAAAAQDQTPKTTPASEPRAVLELFTSQGCSSCPPADALMQTFAARKDVIALSMPVDYWDYLGWKDTLANPKFSQLQRLYAKQRGDGRVYTPQMVVNGRTHVIGSNKTSIETAIASTDEELRRSRVPVEVHADKRHVYIETGAAPEGARYKEATIWLVMALPVVEVKIQRGENRGKTIKYYNVVREMNPIGMWSGKTAKLTLPRDALPGRNNMLCAIIIQAGRAGPIIGAASYNGL